MTRGIFTISLDFELHWGGFEKWPLKQYEIYFNSTREVIPKLLSLFQQSGTHVTWATVGMLMHENKNQMVQHFPSMRPGYEDQKLSAYNFIETAGIGSNELEDPYHYAHSLVKKIIATPHQELSTHSFAHYYCNEPGQIIKEFQADLQSAKKAAATYQVELNSMVFPRNQYNPQYLKVCGEEGIKIIRINPVDWWWQISSTENESGWKRLNRGLDAYFSIGGKTSYPLSAIKKQEGVYLMPASRFLRPYNPKEFFLNNKKIRRIKAEMTRAAKDKEIYHLWWHPHNFGSYTQQNLEGLIDIINHFMLLKKEFGMESYNMNEVVELLKSRTTVETA